MIFFIIVGFLMTVPERVKRERSGGWWFKLEQFGDSWKFSFLRRFGESSFAEATEDKSGVGRLPTGKGRSTARPEGNGLVVS